MTGPYPWGFDQEARDAARDDYAASDVLERARFFVSDDGITAAMELINELAAELRQLREDG